MHIKYKLLILLIICLACISGASASDIDDGFLEASDISYGDIGEIANDENILESADDSNVNDGLSDISVNEAISNAENQLDEEIVSDGNDDGTADGGSDGTGDGGSDGTGDGGSDDPSNDDSETITTDTGGMRNISLSDGYNGYCIDMKLHEAAPGQSFSIRDTSVIMSHIYDTPVGEYLKILFYNYYDIVNADKEVAGEAIWTFTDRYYKDSTNELVQKVIADYDGGLRVADHGAVKKINDTHEMVFDFNTYITSSETIQNYFGYKVNIREIDDSDEDDTTDGSTDGNSTNNGTDGSTDGNSTNNGTDDSTGNSTDDSSDDSTDESDNNSDETNGSDDGNSADDNMEEKSEDNTGNNDLEEGITNNSNNGKSMDSKTNGSSALNHKNNQKSVSGIVAGNPLFVLIVSLILLIFVPLRNKK